MGISIWQLLIVLVIVMLLFGTKKLRNLGSDLGGAVKGFRSAVKQGTDEADEAAKLEQSEESVIEGRLQARSRTAPRPEGASAFPTPGAATGLRSRSGFVDSRQTPRAASVFTVEPGFAMGFRGLKVRGCE